MRHRRLAASLTVLPIVLTALLAGAGCSAQQSPNATLATPGDRSVTVGGWQLEARGEFVDADRTQVRVDLVVRKVGDPSRTIASPAVVVTVGEEATVEITGEYDVAIAVLPTRTADGVSVSATGVIRDGGTVKSTLPLRFAIR